MENAIKLHVSPDPEQMAVRAAAWFAERIATTTDIFRVALSGGSTPRRLYRQLASADCHDRIEWRRVELFWGDERFVPHTDARSNYRMVRETLLAHAPILIDHVHPIITEGDPVSAAYRYEMLLKAIYGSDLLVEENPLFDLVLLGVGEDGHTASLFPGSPVLKEQARWIAEASGRDEPRITLTYPALNSNCAVAFLVTGGNKAEIVRRVIKDGDDTLPATHVRSEGEIVWFLDAAAANKIDASRK
ncbi:MAG: 6-phosphogluconolactonase [Rhizomicrobium sp.]